MRRQPSRAARRGHSCRSTALAAPKHTPCRRCARGSPPSAPAVEQRSTARERRGWARRRRAWPGAARGCVPCRDLRPQLDPGTGAGGAGASGPRQATSQSHHPQLWPAARDANSRGGAGARGRTERARWRGQGRTRSGWLWCESVQRSALVGGGGRGGGRRPGDDDDGQLGRAGRVARLDEEQVAEWYRSSLATGPARGREGATRGATPAERGLGPPRLTSLGAGATGLRAVWSTRTAAQSSTRKAWGDEAVLVVSLEHRRLLLSSPASLVRPTDAPSAHQLDSWHHGHRRPPTTTAAHRVVDRSSASPPRLAQGPARNPPRPRARRAPRPRLRPADLALAPSTARATARRHLVAPDLVRQHLPRVRPPLPPSCTLRPVCTATATATDPLARHPPRSETFNAVLSLSNDLVPPSTISSSSSTPPSAHTALAPVLHVEMHTNLGAPASAPVKHLLAHVDPSAAAGPGPGPGPLASLAPGAALPALVVAHELKELGAHALVCTVSYGVEVPDPAGADGEGKGGTRVVTRSFRKVSLARWLAFFLPSRVPLASSLLPRAALALSHRCPSPSLLRPLSFALSPSPSRPSPSSTEHALAPPRPAHH